MTSHVHKFQLNIILVVVLTSQGRLIRSSCEPGGKHLFDMFPFSFFLGHLKLHQFHTPSLWKVFNLHPNLLLLVDTQPIVKLHHLCELKIRPFGQHWLGMFCGTFQELSKCVCQTGLAHSKALCVKLVTKWELWKYCVFEMPLIL